MKDLPSHCTSCGRTLPPGRTKYLVKISITADFDGILPDYGEAREIESEIRRTLAAAAAASSDLLEAEVHEAFALLLCLKCRKALASALSPFSPHGRLRVQ